VSLTLSAHTSRLGPLSVSTHRTPVTFSPLALTATLGSPAALGAALVGRYGAEALAQSAALVGSLQLLGNPTRLLRSVGAGLSDALSLPLRGLTEGPRQFVAGLGAGGTSLLMHVSHGALTCRGSRLTCSVSNARTRSRNRSPTHSLTRSLAHTPTRACTDSLTHALTGARPRTRARARARTLPLPLTLPLTLTGALTSVSDFTSAVAANLGVEAGAPQSLPPPPPPGKRRHTTPSY